MIKNQELGIILFGGLQEASYPLPFGKIYTDQPSMTYS